MVTGFCASPRAALPGIETRIKRETGYNRETIILALNDLCKMVIDGHRVLLAYQPVGPGGTFLPNQYLIFPTAEEVEQYCRCFVATRASLTSCVGHATAHGSRNLAGLGFELMTTWSHAMCRERDVGSKPT